MAAGAHDTARSIFVVGAVAEWGVMDRALAKAGHRNRGADMHEKYCLTAASLPDYALSRVNGCVRAYGSAIHHNQ